MGMVLIIFGILWILLALFFVAALACSAKRDPADLEWKQTTEPENESVLGDWCEKALSA